MTRDYSKVRHSFWSGATGRALRHDPDAQRTALYLITCAASNMIGLYRLALPAAAHEIGLISARLTAALERLSAAGFCDYDPSTETIWVRHMAYHQLDLPFKSADSLCVRVRADLDGVADSPFIEAFCRQYGVALCLDVPLKGKKKSNGETDRDLPPYRGGGTDDRTPVSPPATPPVSPPVSPPVPPPVTPTKTETETETEREREEARARAREVLSLELDPPDDPAPLGPDVPAPHPAPGVEAPPALQTTAPDGPLEQPLERAVLDILHGGPCDPDVMAARAIYDQYASLFAAGSAPRWRGGCMEAIIRARLWLRRSGDPDPDSTLRAVVEYCGRGGDGSWRRRGTTPDRLHKFPALFGAAGRVAETLGVLVAEVAGLKAERGNGTRAASRPVEQWTHDELRAAAAAGNLEAQAWFLARGCDALGAPPAEKVA